LGKNIIKYAVKGVRVMDRLIISKGDIVRLKIEAIVNASNTSLLGGGGVARSIQQYAGDEYMKACIDLGGCSTGEAKITPGFKLNAKYVIHTSGPIWRGGDKGEPELLKKCYDNCLAIALENNIKSIAFPSISTGVYRYPVEQAMKIALNEIISFLHEHPEMEKIVIICIDEKTTKLYKSYLKKIEASQEI